MFYYDTVNEAIKDLIERVYKTDLDNIEAVILKQFYLGQKIS